MWPSRRPSWCSGWRSMAAVRAEVLELVFAGAVLAVFGSAVGALYGRISRQALTLLAAIGAGGVGGAGCRRRVGRLRARADGRAGARRGRAHRLRRLSAAGAQTRSARR